MIPVTETACNQPRGGDPERYRARWGTNEAERKINLLVSRRPVALGLDRSFHVEPRGGFDDSIASA